MPFEKTQPRKLTEREVVLTTLAEQRRLARLLESTNNHALNETLNVLVGELRKLNKRVDEIRKRLACDI